MRDDATMPPHTPHRFRGLYGVALFAALTAWTVFANPTVFATPGGPGNRHRLDDFAYGVGLPGATVWSILCPGGYDAHLLHVD